jgi:hypothetical protein
LLNKVYFFLESVEFVRSKEFLSKNIFCNLLIFFLFQVIYLKGELSDLIVLDPCWLTQSVCGELLSANFFERSSKFAKGGSYSLNEFQLAAPDWDAIDLLPLLESLGLCTQVDLARFTLGIYSF